MGGIGVDPFAKTTQSESENVSSAMRAVCNTDQQWQLDSQGRWCKEGNLRGLPNRGRDCYIASFESPGYQEGQAKGGKGLNFVADLRYCEFSINALPIFSVKKLASLCSVMCGRPATSQERALQKLNPRGQIQTNGQPMSKYSKAFEQHLPVKHFGGLFWGKATPQCQYPQQRELLFQEFHTVTCFAAFALRNRKAECSSSLPIPPCRFLRPHFIDLYSKAIDHSIALQVELSGELPPLRSLPYGSLDHREFASSFNFTQLL